jgi:YHS domain-containing protein
MSALFYFLIWGGLIFLMMRYGCGAHVMGHGHGEGKHGDANDPQNEGSEALRWVPPAKDVDPICGKTVSTDLGKPSVHDGRVYYFCSRECREVFEAAPAQYVGPDVQGPSPQPHTPSQLENHHV